jgi:predicted TIM-barrel fold metal-dependent hydrolase
MEERLVSADSHVMEPPDLWLNAIGGRFGDRTPQVRQIPGRTGHFLVAPGVAPYQVAHGFGLGKGGKELREHLGRGYEAARPSGWDPAARIADQEVDHIAAEVLYTTLGLSLFALDDAELQRASFAVYNDWIAEFAAYSPRRLYPVALISLEDVGAAVRELQRCARRGLKGAMIWSSPPAEQPYHSPVYTPFWQCAEELGMPLTLHVITDRKQGEGLKLTGAAGMFMNLMTPVHEIQKTLLSLIFYGVLERHPRLKFVIAENDSGWVAHFMYRIDHMFEKFGAMTDQRLLSAPPSDYIRRNVWVTFQDDLTGVLTTSYFGADNFMWASDFPHTDTTWPNSAAVVERNFTGIAEAIKRKVVFDNTVKLYGMDIT